MIYRIGVAEKMPDMDGVSVAKIKNYPLEKEDYKPFAQFRAAISNEGFHIKMTSFEAKPDKHSTLAFVIAVGEAGRIAVAADNGRNLSAIVVEGSVKKMISAEVKVRNFVGEDLQGIYWGAEVTVPAEFIPQFETLKQNGCSGNFFKLCRSERVHFGSFLPYDFADMAASELPDNVDSTAELLTKADNGLGEMPSLQF